MLVVADTGPLHYLVLIAQIDILPQLFGSVRDEPDRPMAPPPVQAWIKAPPPWLSVVPKPLSDVDITVSALDAGERAASASPSRSMPTLF
jgi:hypothetical protein